MQASIYAPPDPCSAGRTPLRVALLEPFWGGSHRASAEGWARWSRHRIRIESLPPRFWKWRMRAAAFDFARRLGSEAEGVDVLFATDLLDLAHLRGLLSRRVSAVLYLHENQVSYPPRPGEAPAERDLQYAFTNVASALAADRVLFNSAFQMDAFFSELERVLRRMPDRTLSWAGPEIRRKSAVLPLGVELSDLPGPERNAPEGPPLILWNHRWEYDKDPETFFAVLQALAERGADFRLAVAGERFGRAPEIFERARKALGARCAHWGYLPDRAEYVRLLGASDIVVSTALQENFGLSMIEAAFAGAHPLAPDRLAYPEVFPPELHGPCLYGTPEALLERLDGLLTGRLPRLAPELLRRAFTGYAWEARAGAFDDLVCQVSGRGEM
jgi:glycosyltransferase involved in cell wall biosynthesis